MRRFRFDRRLTALAAAVAFASAACVHQGPGQVKINPIEANLVFGVKPAQVIAPVPAQVQPDLVPNIVTQLALPPLTLTPLGAAPKSDCPAAGNTATVETPTDVNITGKPLVGVTRWKHTGQFTLSSGQKVAFTGFERRVVRNFQQISPTLSEFETVQPFPGVGGAQYLQSTFRVNTAGVTQTVEPPVGNGLPAPPSIHAPDAGIVLVETRTVDRTGNSVGTPFTPVNGMLMLPLPVPAGDRWQSVGIDPKSGETIVQDATVDRRKDIDACGDLIDGWHVTATQTIASVRNAAPQVGYAGYEYIIATQFGGMIIDERLTAPDPLGQNNPLGATPSPFDLDYTLAQLHPDPLPS